MIYAPIRMHPDGEEWIEWSQSSHIESYVLYNTRKAEKQTPDWCRKYPLLRIGYFECTEIKEG